MDISWILKILIIACGIYMIYWAVQMKQSGKIPEMLVGKGFPVNRAKDPEGFIRYTFPFTFGTGLAILIFGLISALELLISYPVLDIMVNLAVVAAIIIYGMILMKAQKKYLVGMDISKEKKTKK